MFLTSDKYRTIALAAELAVLSAATRVLKDCGEATVPIDGAAHDFIKSETQQEEEENYEDIASRARYISYFQHIQNYKYRSFETT
jgi:hypothetical protein